jgi:conjugal transfer mating pair stabilization protein TraG
MNEWIPIIRAIMTAIAIGVIPFLVLFLPTPIVGKAASVMLGFFVFLSTWGVTDAVIHSAAMDYAARNFEEVRQSSFGVYAMAALPSVSTKMLAMFGMSSALRGSCSPAFFR